MARKDLEQIMVSEKVNLRMSLKEIKTLLDGLRRKVQSTQKMF